MKYCHKCGKELFDEAVICPGCGCEQEKITSLSDSSSFGWALVGFLVPIVGLILYLMWKDKTPLKAKSAGKGALVSAILSVVFFILYMVFIIALISYSVMYY